MIGRVCLAATTLLCAAQVLSRADETAPDLAQALRVGWVAGPQMREQAEAVGVHLDLAELPALMLRLPTEAERVRLDPRKHDLRDALASTSDWVAKILPNSAIEELVIPYRRDTLHDGLCILRRTAQGLVQTNVSSAHVLVLFRANRLPELADRELVLAWFLDAIFGNGKAILTTTTPQWEEGSREAVGFLQCRPEAKFDPPRLRPWYATRKVLFAVCGDTAAFLAFKMDGGLPRFPEEELEWFGPLLEQALPPYPVELNRLAYDYIRPQPLERPEQEDPTRTSFARWKQRLEPLTRTNADASPRTVREAVVAEVLTQFRANEAAAKAAKEPDRTKLLAEVRDQRVHLFEMLVFLAEVQEDDAAWRQWLIAQAQTLLVLPKLPFPTLTAAQQAQAAKILARMRELAGQQDSTLADELKAVGVFLDEYYWQALDQGARGQLRQTLYYHLQHPASIPRLLVALGTEADSNLRRAIAKQLANTVTRRSAVDDEGKIGVKAE